MGACLLSEIGPKMWWLHTFYCALIPSILLANAYIFPLNFSIGDIVKVSLFLLSPHNFLFAPSLCILRQDKLCKANTWQRAQPTIDVVLLLSEIRIGTGKNDNWPIQTANIPAVTAAAAAASGANLKASESFNLDVISSGKCNQAAATVKCNHAGEIAGMRRLYNSIGGFQSSTAPSGLGLGAGLQRIISGAFPQQPQAEDDSFNGMLLNKFVRLLQQFVNIAEKGGEVVRSEFRDTCSQATVLLLSHLVNTFLACILVGNTIS